MRRLTLLFFLLLAAPAGAATFGEAPSRLLPGYADCVSPTGGPGEVVAGSRVLRATRDGFTVVGTLPLDRCVTAAIRPNGAGVAASPRASLEAAVRDAGGVWRKLELTDFDVRREALRPQVAISDSGHAIVAWVESELLSHGPRRGIYPRIYRVKVARRAPGGEFGSPETLGPTQTNEPRNLGVGIAGNGEAFVLVWGSDDNVPPYEQPVTVASAAPGAPFAAPVVLGNVPWRSIPSLAVSADGRALVAFPDGQSLRVAERAPGEGFGAATAVAAATDLTGVHTHAVIGAGGGAAVAWYGATLGGAGLVSRQAPGAFSPAQLRAPATVRPDFDPFYASEWFTASDPFASSDSTTDVHVALTPDGRALVSHPLSERVNGRTLDRVALHSVTLGATEVLTQHVGDEFRRAAVAVPLTLADGAGAVAWATQAGFSTPDGRMRLHLATDGARAVPAGSVPRVRVGELKYDKEWPYLPVTCSAACQVRVQVVDGDAEGVLELRRPGRGRLYIWSGERPLARRRSAPVRFVLSYGGPDTQRPRTRELTLRLRRKAEPPIPHAVGLRAVRQGTRIRVTWRTDRPQPEDGHTTFWLMGSPTREWSGEPPEVRSTSGQGGRRRFTLTLTVGTRDLRYVTLRTDHSGSAAGDERTTVAVR